MPPKKSAAEKLGFGKVTHSCASNPSCPKPNSKPHTDSLFGHPSTDHQNGTYTDANTTSKDRVSAADYLFANNGATAGAAAAGEAGAAAAGEAGAAAAAAAAGAVGATAAGAVGAAAEGEAGAAGVVGEAAAGVAGVAAVGGAGAVAAAAAAAETSYSSHHENSNTL